MGWVSGQAYSDDLRARVLAAVDRGGRVYEVAPLFEVSVSYIYKALARGGSAASRRRCRKPAVPAASSTAISMRSPRMWPPIPTRRWQNSSTGRNANAA
jgi:transposase